MSRPLTLIAVATNTRPRAVVRRASSILVNTNPSLGAPRDQRRVRAPSLQMGKYAPNLSGAQFSELSAVEGR
jgi:hypothetical protein